MKKRNGFVSNSSTTSFCIYGVQLNTNEIKKILVPEQEEDDIDVYELLEEEMKKKNVSLYFCPDYDSSAMYIGETWPSIGDDETGKQFKNRVKKEVNTVLNGQVAEELFGTHEEAWRDG